MEGERMVSVLHSSFRDISRPDNFSSHHLETCSKTLDDHGSSFRLVNDQDHFEHTLLPGDYSDWSHTEIVWEGFFKQII